MKLFNSFYYRAQIGFVLLAFTTAMGLNHMGLTASEQISIYAPPNPIYVDERFLSFSIDTSVFVGTTWWVEGNIDSTLAETEAIDLSQTKLNLAAKGLAPAYLRIGGTTADELFLGSQSQFEQQQGFSSYLDFERFKELADFINRNHLDWMFTLNYLDFKNSEHKNAQLHRFLSWQEIAKTPKPILELGNEVGAFWLFYGWQAQSSMKKYGEDFQTLRNSTPEYSVAGPANAFWPWIGEPASQFFGSSRELLSHSPDIFTWHYYPTQSTRCGITSQNSFPNLLLSTHLFKQSQQQAQKIQNWVAKDSPNTQLILGETGPAQCGGVETLTDRFVSSLWWLSHLGVMATSGQSVVVRQTLVGADYALLNEQLDPNPDYWASWLFKRTMGQKVLLADPLISQNVRSFVHCHASKPDTLSLLLVNASKKKQIRVLSGLSPQRSLLIQSNHLRSALVSMNNKLMEASLLNHNDLEDLPWLEVTNNRFNLPAQSYAFIELKDNQSLCQPL